MRDRLQELTGTDRITTDQGDYVGTIPDESYRERILESYNSTREADLEDMVTDKDNTIEELRQTISDQEMKIIEQEEELKELGDILALHNATIQELQEKLAQHAD
jgi:uncharacterized coiled-coil protein SlyX